MIKRSHNIPKECWGTSGSTFLYFSFILIVENYRYMDEWITSDWLIENYDDIRGSKINQTMFWARLGLRRKGLKSSGANQYPINTKLTPRFLVFLRRPVVLTLINLYMTAEEKAIRMDLILMSPKVKIFSSLNLVMLLDNLTSMSSSDWI